MPIAFIGRDNEVKTLESIFNKKISSLVAIKGRRRIGKSRLTGEFCQGKQHYRFVGLPPKPGMTAQDQRDAFARKLCEYWPETPALKADDWSELFSLLAQHCKRGKLVICFDEISWMAHGDHTFLSKLKNAWDEEFKDNNGLMLILCGSVSSWIDKNILSASGFVGRVHYVMTVKELPLDACNLFWGKQASNKSAYDKFKMLSITGGVPLYLEFIDTKQTSEHNMHELCYMPGGLLVREFDNIFNDLFMERSATYKRIVGSLVNGKKSTQQIAKAIGFEASGILTEYLTDLHTAGFISRDFSWNISTGKDSKLSLYRLSDNYVRFYLRYLAPVKQQIENGDYIEKSVTNLPGWSSIMGLQFENLVVNNKRAIQKHLNINPNDILTDGPFFQNKTSKQAGCQIDYMLQTTFNNLFVCEVRFSRKELGIDIIHEIKDKIGRIKKGKSFSCLPVLIHVNGVSDEVLDADYFVKIIDFAELL